MRKVPYLLTFFISSAIGVSHVSYAVAKSIKSQQTNSVFPRGCVVTGYGYQNQFLILNELGQQTLYLIQNRANKKIELEHFEIQEAFMSPKLESQLNPHHWSAFASDIANLHFKCITTIDGVRSEVNCADVLDVCQYPRVKFALSNMGNYWVSTNKPRDLVIKDATAKGIYLRW